MDAIRLKTCAWTLAALLSAPLHAGEDPPVAVLGEAPACEYRKLGPVSIEAGHRVHEHTTDVTAVSYPKAFAKLLMAAEAKGGNAVILRGHRATYFTRRGVRKPAHVQLRGAAIGIGIEDDAACKLLVIDVREFAKRTCKGEAVNLESEDAYSD